MKRTILIAMVMVFFFVVPAYAEDIYFCFADKSTGFVYDKDLKEWVNSNYQGDHKYIVSKLNVKGKIWEVKKLGNDASVSICEDHFNESGILLCDGICEFKMNKINRRYILTCDVGYYYSGEGMKYSDEKSATPFIQIGKCSPIPK